LLQTGASLGDILITFLPAIVLITIVVLVYFRGKGGNKKIVEAETKKVSKAFYNIAEDIVQSASGLTFTVQLKRPSTLTENDPLKSIRRLRFHFSLEDRQNLVSWFILLFKKNKDYFILESDSLNKNDHINLEIVEWTSLGKYELKKLQEEWGSEMYDYEIKSEFSAKFIHKVNHLNALKYIYQKEPDLKKLIYNLPGFYRLSLKRKEEWGFRLAVRIQKEMDYRIIREVTLRIMRGLSDLNQAIIKKPKRFLRTN